MNFGEYKVFLKPILLIISGLLLLCFAAYLVISSGAFSSSKVEIIDNSLEPNTKVQNNTTGDITVEVAGEVVKPGVYNLPSSARVQDALSLAGDINSEADKDFISKSINKAAKLIDGQKIYIPKKGETGPVNVLSAKAENGSLININSASQSQLESLPGVGAVTAGKIIAGRPYGSLEELTSKKAVTSSVYQKIKDKITLF